MISWLGMRAYKANVTGAFTLNRPTQRDMFVMPTQMKMDPCVWVLYGEKHGLTNKVTAESLEEFLPKDVALEIVAARSDLDIIGVAGSHVDDFIYAGKDDDERWIQA